MKTKLVVGLTLLWLVVLVARAGTVTLQDFKLTADLSGDAAAFTLTANAVVEADGDSLALFSGPVALTGVGPRFKGRLLVDQDRFVARFDRRGTYPLEVHFNAAVRSSNDWRVVDFQIAKSVVQPLVVQGLAADTEFQFPGAARLERSGNNFLSYLPADGTMKLAWKAAHTEAEGKLFYAAEMISQTSVSPGLMRQTAVLTGKIMQGEMNRLVLRLSGAGEVTRVIGDAVLAWQVEPLTNTTDRRLVVQFNQPQKDAFAVTVQLQTPLGEFPQTLEVVRVQPEGATRFAGYCRMVNDGAVRLEVLQAGGLSQISPEQFPETAVLHATGSQCFAYRFSSAEFALRLQADQILPEIGVAEVLACNLGENELSVDAELELDIREAPLRELRLSIPSGYVVARLTAAGLGDYFTGGATNSELRLVYSQPVSGRQVIQLRLEHNQSLSETNWTLPRIDVQKAKTVRGFVGVSADSGFRLTTERTQSLTELATAFFPRTLPGIQAAFRLSDPNWSATLRVERLPQTVQADGFHLFSIGEGIAYGSSVINYVVSGAPVTAFRVELSDEYFNVEFTGKDIRSWEKTTNGWLVQLHTPVAGAYTLLATYERPFKPQGETLAFTGARPLGTSSESGHTIIISAYQFQVRPVEVSAGLLALEPGEVPSEYRLFFDQPVLAAYRYSARPFQLKLALSPLVQGDSLAQVVDRAQLTTHVAKEGQAVTEARYYVKNRGNPNFQITLPEGAKLWSATVNGASVVPVLEGKSCLIPLPPHADPDTVLTVEVKLAASATEARRLTLAAPVLAAPMMLAEWNLQPDEGQRLNCLPGALVPREKTPDISGFAQLVDLFQSDEAGSLVASLVLAFACLLLGLVSWRWAVRAYARRALTQYRLGAFAGGLLLVLALLMGVRAASLLVPQTARPANELSFLIPVQPAQSVLSVEVTNLPQKDVGTSSPIGWWPVLPAVVLSLLLRRQTNTWGRAVGAVLVWTWLAWAALRMPNGGPIFVALLGIFIAWQLIIPAAKNLARPPRMNSSQPPTPDNPAPTMALWLIGVCLLASATTGQSAIPSVAGPESVTQQIRVEDKFILGTAKIHWNAEKGQCLPLLYEPAVLTQVHYPKALDLVASPAGSPSPRQLVARSAGTFDIEVQYQLQVAGKGGENGFALPLPAGLVNRATLLLAGLDVDVYSQQAVAVQRTQDTTNTVASLVLSPGPAWIGWKPRSRDVKREKAVFYAELTQLDIPAAGVVEGLQLVAIRPAQGELSELVFNVPLGATITDVMDAVRTSQPAVVSLWRFDPDTRKLRVTLNPAQSKPLTLLVRSQVATGPLPFTQRLGLLSVEGAAGQVGLLGVATGNEVQLDDVTGENLSPINLEDFPGNLTAGLATTFPGITVRRAYRYADVHATVSLKAAPVEPDVRVETQDTLSLGEDRTVLASTMAVDITRAGIFRLSFQLPEGFDVESISGNALSHWTELKLDSGRLITLNLTGKTDGQQQFLITLAGPGVHPGSGWTVPQIHLREAEKQRGTLLIVPEQGMRLSVAARDGVTQLDPQKSGIRQKGVLAFRILEAPWRMTLDVEQVDPWIQVNGLQYATVNESQIKVTANLQYQIENTGLKSLRVRLPEAAQSVGFRGEQVSDFHVIDGAETNGLRTWEVRLHRRVIGQYLLQVNYQTPIEATSDPVLRGVQAVEVNLQRGFVAVQSAGRLQVSTAALPAALQPAEWQSVPRNLQRDQASAPAGLTCRLVEPDFALPLKLERREAAKLLPARVKSVTFTSVISDAGVMLTQARLEILPGDKRLLHFTLPAGAKFWSAFVNENGVWPWREQDQILIPLEPGSRSDAVVPVEIYFSSETGRPGAGVALQAPKFDLPLEDLTWQIYLDGRWRVQHWEGSLQLQPDSISDGSRSFDVTDYLAAESSRQQQKTAVAEQMLALGNSALQKGDPQAARRAFRSAFGLSTHDLAFNEDARVQLNNLKLQQAVVGLNARQAAVAAAENNGGAPSQLANANVDRYTQQDAQQLIARNSADENTAFQKLAERLIQQQDAAVGNPAVIRANVPEQGRCLTFKRAVVVDSWADLNVRLNLTTTGPSNDIRWFILTLTAVALTGLLLISNWLRRPVVR